MRHSNQRSSRCSVSRIREWLRSSFAPASHFRQNRRRSQFGRTERDELGQLVSLSGQLFNSVVSGSVTKRRAAASMVGQGERLEERTLLSTVKITAPRPSATEGGGGNGNFGQFQLIRDGNVSAALTVTVSLSGTADSGIDYNAPSTSVYFPAGVPNAYIDIYPIDDPWDEPTETVVATILSGAGYSPGSPGSATVQIFDNDPDTATVTIVAIDSDASEDGPDTGTYLFQRNGGSSGALTVNFTVPGSSTVPGSADSGSDYIPIGSSVVIPAWQTSTTLTLTPIDDSLSENTESVTVTLAPGGYLPPTSSAQVFIEDNDFFTSTVSVTATDASASETAIGLSPDTGTFTFTRTGVTSLPLTVDFTLNGSSATSGVDYSPLPTSVSFAANETSKTLTVTPIDDIWDESLETVIVTLTGNGYMIGSQSTATVTIADNDPELATVTVAATDPTASEPGTDTGTFTFSRTGGSSAALTVIFSVSGNAISGSDYLPILPGISSIVFPAGQATTTLTLTPLDDTLYDPDETAVVTLTTGSGYNIGFPNSAIVSILDDELPPPTVIVEATDPSASEPGTNTGTYTFTRSGSSSAALTVNFSVSGNAIFGSDYIPFSSSVEIPAGQTSTTLTLTPIDDIHCETNETVALTLVSGAYIIGSPSQATVTILDDEPPAPGSTSVTLQTANTNGVIEMTAGQTSQNVSLTWSAAVDADSYDIQLWKFEGTGSNGGWVLQGGTEQTTALSKLYSGLTAGLYAFYVRGTNCGGVQKGPWAGKIFAIVANGDLTPSNTGQHNNYEDVCGCDSPPPSETAAGASVNSGTGDLLLPLGSLIPTAPSSLKDYLLPSYVLGGDSQITVNATVSLPAAATAVAVDIVVRDQNGVIVGLDTFHPGTNSSQINLDGTMSLKINPNNLKDAAGNPVAPLVSGNYKITMNIRADLPGWAPAAPISINYQSATVDVQYVNPGDRSFSKGFAAPGLNRLRVDTNGLSLSRGNGTSVRFPKIAANTYNTPDGSFTSVATVTMNVSNPLGGADRTAAYKLTTTSGMISLYDAAGLLLERCEANGDVIRFAYQDKKGDGTADDLVRAQSVNTNQYIDYNYVAGEVQTVTDWVGKNWNYTYDANGMLTSMTGPAPTAGAAAPKVVLTYDPGTTRIATYTVTDTASSFTQTTEVDWDSHGNVSQIRAIDTQGTNGGTRTWSFVSAESRQIDQMRIVNEQGSIGSEDMFDHVTFPDGSVSKKRVDKFGNTIREERTIVRGTADTILTSVYTRNQDGQVTMAGPFQQQVGTDPVTTVAGISYAYDAQGRQTLATYPDGTTEVWTFVGNAKSSNPATYKNRVGNYETYLYSTDGFLTRKYEYAIQGGILVAQSFYTWQSGRLKTSATSDPNGYNGTGTGTEYYYDSQLNLTHLRVTTASATGVLAGPTVGDIWVSFGYDSLQNLDWMTSQYQPTALVTAPSGELVPSATDVNLLAVRTDVTSDTYGRILTTISPVPASGEAQLLSTFTYDTQGRALTSVEPGTTAAATRTTSYLYNSFGELKSRIMPDPDGSSTTLEAPSTEYLYDANGNLLQTLLKNGNGNVTRQRFGFDSIGRLWFESMALPVNYSLESTVMTRYFHDAVGRTTQVISPVGAAGQTEEKYLVTSMAYDDVARRITTSISTSGGITPNVADIVEEFDAIGRPTKIARGSLSRTMRYFDSNTGSGVRGTLVGINDERTADTDLTATKQWWVKYGPTGLIRSTQTPDPDGSGALALLETRTLYDVRGNIDTVTEVSGTLNRVTDYTYDFRDLLQSITTTAPSSGLPGLATSWTYDVLQRRKTETSPSGITTRYDYAADGLLNRIDRDDNNAATTNDWFTQFVYDNLNRVISSITPDGMTSTFYNTLGKVSHTLSPDPDGAGPLPRMSRSYTYATGTPGHFLQQTRDTDPDGADPLLGSQTNYAYDNAGRLIEQYRPKNLNPTGSDWTEVYSDGSASTTPTEKWSYDALGQLLSFTDALGNSTLYSYDTLSRITEIKGQSAVPIPEDNTRKMTYQYSAVTGDLSSTTDPLGRTTQYTLYDGLGRLTSSQRMLGTTINDVTTLTYDGFGRLKTSRELANVTAKAMLTTMDYDLLDRVTKVTDPLGGQRQYVYDTRGFLAQSLDELNQSTYFRYDDIGRLESSWTQGFSQTVGSTRYTYDAMDRVSTITDPLNNVTGYEYDTLGRVTQRTDPAQSAGTPTTKFSYDVDGNLASITDPSNNVTSYSYDHRNRLRQDTITLSGAAATREYWYDNADNQFWAKDRENRWTRYTYDFAFGASDNYRLKSEEWWVSGSTFSNRISRSYDQSQGNGLLATEVRDQRNLATSTDVTSRVSFGYDGLARVIATTDWLQPNTQTEGFELKYFYADKVDRRTSTQSRFVQYAAGGTTETGDQWDFRNTYVWDKLNRVDLITQMSANNPLAATFAGKAVTTRNVDLNYFADSTLQSISRKQGAGTATTASLVTTITTVAAGVKNEGRIESITHSGLTGGNVAYLYGYDDHGRVATFTSPAGTRTYTYDTFDQITGATGGTQTAETFAYDKNGNRTSVAPASGGGSAVIGAYNRVTDDGTYTYQYDKEGNRTLRTLKSTGEYETYSYDYRQRLISVTKKSSSNVTLQTVTYEYDGLDRRMRRTVQNGSGTITQKQRFLYDSNVIDTSFDEVVIVLDELVSGQAYQQVDHRYLNGPEIDQVFADETPGDSVLWYLSDQQNTVRDVARYATITAGALATVRNHLEYDSFGNVTSADDPTTGTANDGDLPGLEGIGNEFSPQRSYTGREPDPATGLIYYRARWFDPQLGRFISEDPIGFAAGDANLSRYVGNSTPNAVDPSGLDEQTLPVPGPQSDLMHRWLAADPESARQYLNAIDEGDFEYAEELNRANRELLLQLLRENASQRDDALNRKAYWIQKTIDEAGLCWKYEPGHTMPVTRESMVKIYSYYATLYEQDPVRNLWAGLAVVAGQAVLRSMVDSMERLPFASAYMGGDDVRKELYKMAQEIFLDMAWTFAAYREGGIERIRGLHGNGELSDRVRHAWEAIHAGDISRGSLLMAEEEQLKTLRRGYERINAIAPSCNGRFGGAAMSPLPGALRFDEMFPQFWIGNGVGDFTDTDVDPLRNDRMIWITHLIGIWAIMTPAQRNKMVDEALESVQTSNLFPDLTPGVKNIFP
jgi:RHS repeat-associated protein